MYLEDVLPDGRSLALTEGILRSIHRRVSAAPSPYRLEVPYHSFRQADALPLVPGEPAEIELGLLPVSALIRKRAPPAGGDRRARRRHLPARAALSRPNLDGLLGQPDQTAGKEVIEYQTGRAAPGLVFK